MGGGERPAGTGPSPSPNRVVDGAGDGGGERGAVRAVWFYRDYARLSGGHVKHAHYFDHVRRMPGFAPRITFREAPRNEALGRERNRLWPLCDGDLATDWEPEHRDVLFLAGLDWRFLARSGLEGLPNARINLVQHVRHAHDDDVRYRFLSERAIRICVSQEVADAIAATGRTNGPILTIPNGVDVTPFEAGEDGSPAGFDGRPQPVTIVGYKSPDLARALAERLDAEGIGHRLLAELIDRDQFLDLLAASRLAVCLPHAAEGFYLPALEAMALGCQVVTVDCIGNRSFCLHERSCLLAEPDPDSLGAAAKRALAMTARERGRMHCQARYIAARHSLQAERAKFHAVLADVDRLWSDVTKIAVAARSSLDSTPSESEAYRPLLDFMIVGAQRCGTSALAQFLSRHPDIAMSSPKEVHLFDEPGYSTDWTQEEIDARYRRAFNGDGGARVRGEATPIYLFFPEIAGELKRYNPGLKVIVILRDPVERAISGYYLEKNRGREPRPLWLALLLEPLRVRRAHHPRAAGSLTRVCTYRLRGLYSRQLRNLFRHFDREQVLILRTRDLERHHDAALRRAFAFLGVDEAVRIEPERANHADRGGRRHRVVSWLLRLSYLAEFARMRALARSHPELAAREPPPPES